MATPSCSSALQSDSRTAWCQCQAELLNTTEAEAGMYQSQAALSSGTPAMKLASPAPHLGKILTTPTVTSHRYRCVYLYLKQIPQQQPQHLPTFAEPYPCKIPLFWLHHGTRNSPLTTLRRELLPFSLLDRQHLCSHPAPAATGKFWPAQQSLPGQTTSPRECDRAREEMLPPSHSSEQGTASPSPGKPHSLLCRLL